MDVVVGRDALDGGGPPGAVTIGTFDGVHVGHLALVERTVELAAGELDAVVVTWDRHPNATLRPDRVPPKLTTLERKAELLEAAGADRMVILEFDEELSRWPPERFATEVVAGALRARHVVAGRGWRFGHGATGDVALLARLGAELGFAAHEVEPVAGAGEPASSTRARAAVAGGDLELARALLERFHDLDGEVIRGDGRGRELGYPTANLQVQAGLVHPPRGVYAGRARAGGRWYPAAVNIGVNPTFGGTPQGTPLRFEPYLLDFEGELYGERVRLELWRRLRDEIAFSSVEELVAQMALDVEATRALTG